jgi:hypothetical protein
MALVIIHNSPLTIDLIYIVNHIAHELDLKYALTAGARRSPVGFLTGAEEF